MVADTELTSRDVRPSYDQAGATRMGWVEANGPDSRVGRHVDGGSTQVPLMQLPGMGLPGPLGRRGWPNCPLGSGLPGRAGLPAANVAFDGGGHQAIAQDAHAG